MKTIPVKTEKKVFPYGHIEPGNKTDSTFFSFSPPGPIGLVAGNGLFPALFLESARKKGYDVVVVAHQGETDPSVESFGVPVRWIRVGQIDPIFKTFHKYGVKAAAFAGGIKKPRLFDLRPDWRGVRVLARVAVNHDDQVLRALADEFEQESIRIVPSTWLLPELTAPEGVLGVHQPTDSEREDVRIGFEAGKVLGKLDVGQCVVVKEKVILALEAIEGTDETIRRGAGFTSSGIVVVKMAKPGQDLRFDLPSVGMRTLDLMTEVGARVLALEAGKSLILDTGHFLETADRYGICVLGVAWD
ncbi:MAG: UDP-2,3-diacylglucosamine diphosphatase LpxI [Nitrospirae bacterium]|jgi:hypothetical protein|nr:UDP-2,3-diacylglucosamine diphosphatase LpxI [Nitrospirota bacterium]